MRKSRITKLGGVLAGLLLLVLLLVSPYPPGLAKADAAEYANAVRKLRLIASGEAQRGARVQLSGQELNAYLTQESKRFERCGITNARVESLGQNSAVATAEINFATLQKGLGDSFPALLEGLLSGKRPVRISGRLRSANRLAQVNVDYVEVSGVAMPGSVFEFLSRNIALKDYPDVHLGEPFELGYGVERVAISPEGVSVFIAGEKTAAR